jgi:hypothetical protein
VENECNTSFLTFFHRHGTELRGQQQHQPAEPLRTVRYVSLIPIASIVCCVLHHLSLIHGRVCIVILCEHVKSAIRLSVPVFTSVSRIVSHFPPSQLMLFYATRLHSRHSFDGRQGCCESQIRVHEARGKQPCLHTTAT